MVPSESLHPIVSFHTVARILICMNTTNPSTSPEAGVFHSPQQEHRYNQESYLAVDMVQATISLHRRNRCTAGLKLSLPPSRFHPAGVRDPVQTLFLRSGQTNYSFKESPGTRTSGRCSSRTRADAENIQPVSSFLFFTGAVISEYFEIGDAAGLQRTIPQHY